MPSPDPKSATKAWYRTPTARGFAETGETRVDREKGLLRGYVAMEVGEAEGHGEEADLATLDKIVELTAGRRVKMRFGHPGLSNDAIGSSVGRGFNYRRVGNRLIGDAELLKAADSSPKGQLRTHILDLAEEAPELFGTSFHVKRDLEYRRGPDGARLKGDDGEPLLPLIRPKEVMASDFVDRGALTTALFSGTGALLSAEASEQLSQFLDQDDAPERIRSFLQRSETEHPGAMAAFRAALEEGDAMPETQPDKGKPEPEAAPALSNDEAIKRLEAAGFQVKRPAPTKAEEPPKDDLVLSELAAIKQQLAEEKAARVEAEAKALESARETKIAGYKSRLDNLAHLGADAREKALKVAGLYLKAGEAEDAEAIIAGAEKFQDPLADAMLAEQISVPLAEGEGSQTVDLSVFADYVETPDGGFRRELKGNRQQLARAALAEQIEDPEARRQARMESWVARRNEEMGGVR